jgi:hypothetical protein
MTNTNTHKDEIDYLIIVTCTVDDTELRNEALSKLESFGLSKKQIMERFMTLDSFDVQMNAIDKSNAVQFERNKTERYSTTEMVKIFLGGPYLLFKLYDSGLVSLHQDNYKVKFKQRLYLLIAGTLFWIFLGISVFKYSEYQRQKEIDNADTTEWEQNRTK